MIHYSDIVEQAEWDGATLRASVPADWSQGRTIFGGISVGLALRTMHKSVEESRPLRSILTAFIAPARAGAVTVSAQVLRSGRNVTHTEAKVMQGDTLCCTVLACYGRDRDAPVQVAPGEMPRMPGPDELPPTPFVPGISPEFTKFIEYRWAPESMPYLGNGTGTTDGWIRLRHGSPITSDLFAVLVDAWPTPALSMLRGPAPVSSLTWSLEITGLNPVWRTDEWWRVHARIDSAAAGYVHGDALIWGPDGTLAARSRQTVTVYTRDTPD